MRVCVIVLVCVCVVCVCVCACVYARACVRVCVRAWTGEKASMDDIGTWFQGCKQVFLFLFYCTM